MQSLQHGPLFSDASSYYFYLCACLLLHLTACSTSFLAGLSLCPKHRYFLRLCSPTLLLLKPTYDFSSDGTQIYGLSPISSGLQPHFPTIGMILTLANFICLMLNSSSIYTIKASFSSGHLYLFLFFLELAIIKSLKPGCYSKCLCFSLSATFDHWSNYVTSLLEMAFISILFSLLIMSHSKSFFLISCLASLKSTLLDTEDTFLNGSF